jgi:molybdate-binding protein
VDGVEAVFALSDLRIKELQAEVERLRLHANSARALIERYRVSGTRELLATALRELDDAMGRVD